LSEYRDGRKERFECVLAVVMCWDHHRGVQEAFPGLLGSGALEDESAHAKLFCSQAQNYPV